MIETTFAETNGFLNVSAEYIRNNAHFLPVIMHAAGIFSKQELKRIVGSINDTHISRPASRRLAEYLSNLGPEAFAQPEQIQERMKATTEGIVRDLVGKLLLEEFVASALRDAGVVILGKTNLSEWANFRSSDSSSGWSGIGGQTSNPYVLDRNPCGSSSGSAVAVAAGLAPLAVGTETDGSVMCPAGINGIVGIKPTVGLVSRDGIIPIAHSQDTAGPMARSVRDAAVLLTAMAKKDEADFASSAYPGDRDYTAGLDSATLGGVRIGVWRKYHGADRRPRVKAIFERTITRLDELGATIIDPIGFDIPDGANDAEYEVLLYEFKAGLHKYLANAGVGPSINTLSG
ncbi:MAG: hypothetical protein IIA60_11285, partial [Candidatus Marinimicrobia bacterium]|nr:hypothetical protein [Candidatus Neomarinimicrobiota bacterium]